MPRHDCAAGHVPCRDADALPHMLAVMHTPTRDRAASPRLSLHISLTSYCVTIGRRRLAALTETQLPASTSKLLWRTSLVLPQRRTLNEGVDLVV